MIKVTDNFLEQDLIKFLENYTLNLPHYWGHTSNADNYAKFYASNLSFQDPLIQYLLFKIQKLIKNKLIFLRGYINVHYSNMPGDWHIDDGDQTILLMVSKTLQKKSGLFEIKENNKIKKFNFIQNRLIFFPAKYQHKGNAPIEHKTPRITLVFKTKFN